MSRHSTIPIPPCRPRRVVGAAGLIGHLAAGLALQTALWPIVPRPAWALLVLVEAVGSIPVAFDAMDQILAPVAWTASHGRPVRVLLDLSAVWTVLAVTACVIARWPIRVWLAPTLLLATPIIVRPSVLTVAWIIARIRRRPRPDGSEPGPGAVDPGTTDDAHTQGGEA